MDEFLHKLGQRKIVQWAVAYAAGAWVLLQVLSLIAGTYDWPPLAMRVAVAAVAIGFLVALVLAWYHGERGAQRASGSELVIIALLLVIGGGLLWRFAQRASGPTSPAASADAAKPAVVSPAVSDKSVAVLPFANLSDEKANAYFADGMQDEILTKLSKIGALRVTSRTSTQRYASAPENLAEVGRQLGVAHILEGSVQRSGNAVHINVQLIRAASDEHVWAESYNRTLDDVFGVQGEVAQAVAEALKATLTGAEREAVAAKGTENPRAYEAYLRGRAADRSGYSNAKLIGAIDDYYAAVREDPAFVQAWSALAVAMSGLYQNGYDSGRSTAAAVREAADTAMRLQPELAESLLARGAYVYRVEHDYAGAIELYRRALAKQPGDVDILAELMFVERRAGRWDDAIAHYREAIARDPRNVSVLVQGACEIHYWLRRYDEARALLEHALAITPDDAAARACLAQVEQRLGRPDAADAWLARVPRDSRDYNNRLARIDQLAYTRRYDELEALMAPALQGGDAALTNVDLIGLIRLGYAQRGAGKEALARRTFERLEHAIESRPGGIEHVAAAAPVTPLVFAGLGDGAKALATAQRMIELNRNDTLELADAMTVLAQVHAQQGHRDAAIALLPELLAMPAGITPALLVLDPMWDPIRDDPRFVALTRQPLTEYKAPPHG